MTSSSILAQMEEELGAPLPKWFDGTEHTLFSIKDVSLVISNDRCIYKWDVSSSLWRKLVYSSVSHRAYQGSGQ